MTSMKASDSYDVQKEKEGSSVFDTKLDPSQDDPVLCIEKDSELERKARFKLDLVVLPVMAMFYFLSFLDQANIVLARAGWQDVLGLADKQYNVLTTVFNIAFICASVPACIFLRKIGASLLLPITLTAWGLVVVFQGLVTSYAGLLVCRILVGALQGPLLPCIVIYLSGFYTRRDLTMRVTIFFAVASVSGTSSGLLAIAIGKIDGAGGKASCAWILIIQGLLTVPLAVCSFWLVPGSLQDVLLLTQEEKDVLKRRVWRDRSSHMGQAMQTETYSFKETISAITSPHVIIMSIFFFLLGAVNSGTLLYLPSVAVSLGYSPIISQLVCAPPFIGAYLVAFGAAWFADKHNSRGVPLVVVSLTSIAGWAMVLGLDGTWVLYGSLYLLVPVSYAMPPIAAAWVANNSDLYYRRVSAICAIFIANTAGGILSTWSFPAHEGPRYRQAATMLLVFSSLLPVLTACNMVYLKYGNNRKNRLRVGILAPYLAESDIDGEEGAWRKLGDRHPDFRYLL